MPHAWYPIRYRYIQIYGVAVSCNTLRTQKVVPHLGVDEKHQNWQEMARETSKFNMIWPKFLEISVRIQP